MSEEGPVSPKPLITKRAQFIYAGIESPVGVGNGSEVPLYRKKSPKSSDMYTCMRGNIPGFDPSTGMWTVSEKGYYKITISAIYKVFFGGKALEGSTFTKAMIGDKVILGSTHSFTKVKDGYESMSLTSGLIELGKGDKVKFSLQQFNKSGKWANATVELFVNYVSRFDEDNYVNAYAGGPCDPTSSKITFSNGMLQSTRALLEKQFLDEGVWFRNVINYFVAALRSEPEKVVKGKEKEVEVKAVEKREEGKGRGKKKGKGGGPPPTLRSSAERVGVGPVILPGSASERKRSLKGKPELPKITTSAKGKGPPKGKELEPEVGAGVGDLPPGAPKPNLLIYTDDARFVTYTKRNTPEFNTLILDLKAGGSTEFDANTFDRITVNNGFGFKIVTNSRELLTYQGKNDVRINKIQIRYGDDGILTAKKFVIQEFKKKPITESETVRAARLARFQ